MDVIELRMALIWFAMMGIFSGITSGCGGGPTAEPEIHVLPEGFKGAVVLHHQVVGAEALAYEGKSRVYLLPMDGQFRTSSKANFGIRPPKTMQFFVKMASGKRVKIPVKGHDKIADPKTLCILGGYQVATEFYYFVDVLENAGKYKNPAETGKR